MLTLLNAFDKDIAQSGLYWLMDMGIKGGVLLVFALGTTFVLRRRSAATRHLIWTLAMGGLLVLPWLSAWGPTWHIPILPVAKSSHPRITTPAVTLPSASSQVPHAMPSPQMTKMLSPGVCKEKCLAHAREKHFGPLGAAQPSTLELIALW